jgi:hypothetical protein
MNEISYFFCDFFVYKFRKKKFRKTGPRTKLKLPKSPRSLPPQPHVDLSALENYQPRPVNAFSVARNIKKRI